MRDNGYERIRELDHSFSIFWLDEVPAGKVAVAKMQPELDILRFVCAEPLRGRRARRPPPTFSLAPK
jgi:hypothetical protein